MFNLQAETVFIVHQLLQSDDCESHINVHFCKKMSLNGILHGNQLAWGILFLKMVTIKEFFYVNCKIRNWNLTSSYERYSTVLELVKNIQPVIGEGRRCNMSFKILWADYLSIENKVNFIFKMVLMRKFWELLLFFRKFSN